MTIQLKNLSCKYGAPMGRPNQQLSGKVHFQRVKMVGGAYDRGGAYWGMTDWRNGVYPLYVAQDAEGNQAFVRGATREKAKIALQDTQNETISFYR